MDARKEIDVAECLRRGAIGALGAIPGTLAAHPIDLVKIRIQTGAGSVRAAVRGLGTRTSDWPRYYRGLGPGVLQKAATRGPMFLASEVGTQCCETGFGMPREKALVVGSLSSGYVTGFLAASFEWAKVQRSLGAAVGSVSARKRLAVCHGAGLRNAVFDATFFGTEHVARRYGNLPPEATYALGAVAAITLDFPLDVALKRNMAAPTTSPVPRVGATLLAFRLLRDRGFKVVFAGLGVKSCEFGVSYACTGYVSTFFR